MKKTLFLFSLALLLIQGCTTPKYRINAEVFKETAPVLIRKTDNSVLTIKIDNNTGKEITVNSITLASEGTSELKDIKNIRLYFTGLSDQFRSSILFGKTQEGGNGVTIKGAQTLKPGNNYFWASVTIDSTSNLADKINITCKKIEIEGATVQIKDSLPITPSNIGYAVRNLKDDGSAAYRIPGLVCTPKGTLIAAYDIRWNNAVDLQEDIDVGVSRSLDGGQTWLPMQKAIDMGEWGGKSNRENGIGDPAILVDPQTGRIWLSALWLHGSPNKRAWWASQPGLTPEQTGQFILAYSDDEGKTWSEPINITPQVKKPEWYLCFNGPGMGITTKDGVLVFAAQFKDKKQVPHSTIIYSKDKGTTWQIGTGAKSETTEAQVVELADGSLMLNMRDNRGGSRSVAITKDFGQTWEEHSSSRSALPEPVCQASLIRIKTANGQEALAFFNPNSTKDRNNLSLKLSFDEGKTWDDKYTTLVYEPGSYGYSCLAQIDSTTLGVLYEGAGDLYFQQIDLNEVIK